MSATVEQLERARANGERELQYVAGFLFSQDRARVALVSKLKPAWQRGKLNAIGGKIEAGESAWDAMHREFLEEAGADVKTWKQFAILNWRGGAVYFFKARGDYSLYTMTAEPILWVQIADLARFDVVPNVRWLLPLALDKDGVTVVAEDRS